MEKISHNQDCRAFPNFWQEATHRFDPFKPKAEGVVFDKLNTEAKSSGKDEIFKKILKETIKMRF
jgi:hypothetical protein